MPKDHLYHITHTDQQESTITAKLQLHKQHPIFAGHFPGQPVLPGACLLDMVGEVLSVTLQAKYQLKKASSLKFIAPIDPMATPELALKLSYKTINFGLLVTASLSANEVICFKMQGEYDVL